MAEMNASVRVMLQLLEAKQQEAQLEQRKVEADTQHKQFQEQLKATIEERKADRDRQNLLDKIASTKLKMDAAQEFKNRVMAGTERMQGQLGPDQSIPTSQSGPIQSAEIPSPQGRQSIPFQEQIVPTPVGDVNIPSDSIISYDESLQRKLTEMFMQSQGKAREAGLVTQAQEQARQPGRIALETLKGGSAKDLADYRAKQALDLAEINNAAAERRAIIAANSRRQGSNTALTAQQQDIDAYENDARYGVIKLGSTNPQMKARTQLRSKELVPLDPDAAKGIVDVKNLEETINLLKQIQPLLSEGPTGSVTNWVKTQVPGNKLYDLAGAITAKTPLMSNIFGVKGAQSDRDITNLLQGIFSPSTTGSKLKNNISKLEEQARISVLDVQMKGMSNYQKLDTLLHFGLDPVKYNRPINKAGDPLFKQAEDGTWGYYNPSTNKYRRIE
jgi:hypothetical protein